MKNQVIVGSIAMAMIAATAFGAALHPLWSCDGVVVELSAPDNAAPGARMTYEIRIRNGSQCNITNASLSDFIPRRSSFDGADPTPSEVPQAPTPSETHPVARVAWGALKILPGMELRFSLAVRGQAPSGTTLLNSACLESEQSGRICTDRDTVVR